VLQIWLVYSLVLLRYGNGSNDAKQTLKHVQRVRFGKKGWEFYGALTHMEPSKEAARDADGAVSSWRRSMDHGTSIVGLVRSQMKELEQGGLLERNVAGAAAVGAVTDATAAGTAAAPVQSILLPSVTSKGSL